MNAEMSRTYGEMRTRRTVLAHSLMVKARRIYIGVAVRQRLHQQRRRVLRVHCSEPMYL